MTVVGVVALRWVTRAARLGAPSVVLWLLAWLVFFLPLASAVSTLAARYPDQGGLYAWTRRAFGPRHAFVCGWCLWVNNLFYFPSLLLFGAANGALATGPRGAALATDRTFLIATVLALLWLCVAVNVAGWSKAKWLQNLGSIGTWLPALLLIAGGAIALARFGSATSFAVPELVPRGEALGTLSLWSAICFAFSGFELTALVGQEVRHPARTIPVGVVVAGAIVTVIYVAGSTSILIAIPSSDLTELSGITDAVDLVARRVGLSGAGPLTGALLALSAVAMSSSWFAGAARVPFAAGVDRVLPAPFARLHPRFRTPHVVLVAQGVLSSLIFLGSAALAVADTRPSIQDAYDVMVNLTILLYFVPYLYLFAAFVRLRAGGDGRAAPGAGGRRSWNLIAGLTGLVATATSLALVIVPPPDTTSVVNYEVNLFGQAGLLLGVGVVLFRRSRARAGHAPS